MRTTPWIFFQKQTLKLQCEGENELFSTSPVRALVLVQSLSAGPPQAFLRQLLRTGLISKGPLACRGCLPAWKKKKSHTAPSLARLPPLLSLPLRTDRSFSSGSKFTLQTCWEAEQRCHGKAFLHFKDPERLPERLSEILRLIINLVFRTAVAVKRAPRPRAPGKGWRRDVSDRELAGLTFIERANVQTTRIQYPMHSISNKETFLPFDRSFIIKGMSEMYHLIIP